MLLAKNPSSRVLSRACFSKTSFHLCSLQKNTPSCVCHSKTPCSTSEFPKSLKFPLQWGCLTAGWKDEDIVFRINLNLLPHVSISISHPGWSWCSGPDALGLSFTDLSYVPLFYSLWGAEIKNVHHHAWLFFLKESICARMLFLKHCEWPKTVKSWVF